MSNYYKRRYGYQTPWRWWRDKLYCVDRNVDSKIESEKHIVNDSSGLFYIMPFFLIAMLVWKLNTK